MKKLKVLVIDDDPLAQKIMAERLSDHELEFAMDFAGGRQKLTQGSKDLCFIDLQLGENDDCSGLELVPLAATSGVYSVVMSGHDSNEIIERAYDLGCNDFYSKGNEGENIREVVERYLQRRLSVGENQIFQDQFVTEDAVTRASISSALKYATSDLPVIILGPSGSGKTSLAQIIHDRSARQGPFIAINCAAYTEDLLEAELFGYRKGAFTGAVESRKGKLLMADDGTLFLDEVGAMSLKMQTKLLKAIEEKLFYPLGSDRPERSNFRVLSATLEDLQDLVKKGGIRFDFLQRIQGLTINLKPLAQRKDDIIPLLTFFTRRGRRLSFSEDAKQQLLHYDWPGNVRELKKFISLVVSGPTGRITLDMVRELLATARSNQISDAFLTELQYQFILANGLDKAVKRFIDTAIQRNLSENKGRKTKSLSDLDISTGLLYRSLRRNGRSARKHDGDRA
jgi:DNA-binding NtrC family response regulator